MAERGTAERIAAAALEILLREGAQAVTMRRVAADAGVTTMASYRHYPNREALLRSVADAASAELGENWAKRCDEADFATAFYGLLDDFLDFSLGKPNLYAYVVTDRRESTRHFPGDFRGRLSPTFTPVFDVVERGIREGVLRDGDPLEITFALTMPVVGLVQLYLGGRMTLSEKDFRGLCRRTTGRVLDGTATEHS